MLQKIAACSFPPFAITLLAHARARQPPPAHDRCVELMSSPMALTRSRSDHRAPSERCRRLQGSNIQRQVPRGHDTNERRRHRHVLRTIRARRQHARHDDRRLAATASPICRAHLALSRLACLCCHSKLASFTPHRAGRYLNFHIPICWRATELPFIPIAPCCILHTSLLANTPRHLERPRSRRFSSCRSI